MKGPNELILVSSDALINTSTPNACGLQRRVQLLFMHKFNVKIEMSIDYGLIGKENMITFSKDPKFEFSDSVIRIYGEDIQLTYFRNYVRYFSAEAI